MVVEPTIAPGLELSVPSCAQVGLQASKKGNFQVARQMLLAAMEQLEGHEDKQARLIELTTNVADTYINEGHGDTAKLWYAKALHLADLLYGKNSLRAACLIVRLAEICVLQSDMSEFKKHFEDIQRAYLLSVETNISILLGPLIDLSWSLCVQGYLTEVQVVNRFITSVKQLEDEDRLDMSIA